MPDTLARLFETLPASTDGDRFSAALIDDGPHRIARDVNGNPVLLIAVQSSEALPPPPLILEHMSVQHDVLCRLAGEEGKEESRTFTLVRCTTHELGEHFLRVLGPIVEMLGTEPTRKACALAIHRIAKLFEALQQPSARTTQGLFAELVVFDSASCPVELARAWHIEPEDRFDFNSGSVRIEVKSTSGEQRVHHFSLEQVRPTADVEVYVVSIRIARAANGLSLGELLDRVRGRLGSESELLLRFDQVVSESLGGGAHRALRERFDDQLARASMRIYRGEDVPSVDPDLPTGVAGVRFTSELDHLTPLSRSSLSDSLPLLGMLAGADVQSCL